MDRTITNYWITTNDNPFNPFTRFDDWFRFDLFKGYNTCGYLARVCIFSDSLSEFAKAQAIEDAIDDILENNAYAKEIYRKVSEKSEFLIN